MKKLISLVLVLVLVFSLAVPSFAYPHSSTQLEALNEIEYWTYWIFQDFTGYFNDINDTLDSLWEVVTLSIGSNIVYMRDDIDSIASNIVTLASRSESSLSNLVDINEYLRSVNDEITSLNNNLFGSLMWIDPFADVIQKNSNTIVSKLTNLESDIAQLKEVLADDEDLAFKESQKENQQYIQDTFFKPGSDLSLNVSELTDFTSQFTDFTDSFDFIEKVGTSTSPLESISEGSDFSQWFTNETGQDMDPTFGGGSGGGGETPDPGPGPDEPDPDEPDPDEPDPPTPTITNLLPTATSTYGGSEIYNGKGWKENTRISSSGFYTSADGLYATGFINVPNPSTSNVVYLYNISFSSDNLQRFLYYIGSDGNRGNISIWTYSPDSNGVYAVPLDVADGITAFRVVSSYMSSDSIITLNQYPIQTASTFSLRAQSVPYEPEIVTSAYSDRMNEFYNLLGGDD